MLITIEELRGMTLNQLQDIGGDATQRQELCRELKVFPCVCGTILEKNGAYDLTCDECGSDYNCYAQRILPQALWDEPWDGEGY